MGDVLEFPILPDSDLGRQLVVDMCRFSEGIVTEKAIRKKYKFDEAAWEKLGEDDSLVRAIEDESLCRIRDGSTKREKAQKLVVAAPDVAASIMNSAEANDRHRLDACKVLNDFAANGPAGVPASDRFQITINLGADTVLKYDRSITPDPNDVDPNDPDTTPRVVYPTIATKKPMDDQW